MSTPGEGKRRRAAAFAAGFKAGQESMASVNPSAPSRDDVQTVADCQPRQSPDGKHYIHAHNCAFAIRNNLPREDAPSAAAADAPAPMSRELIGKIVDDVFGGAIEDASVIEEIYAAIKKHETPAPQEHVAAQDVINLVIAAREAFDSWTLPECESRALDKALEPFAERVPYENEPAATTEGSDR